MIYTTQGHQLGVGLEIFLKSIHQNNFNLENHVLICFKESLLKTLSTLNFDFTIKDNVLSFDGFELKLDLIKKIENTETIDCLLKALSLANKADIIHTLPSSKDQFKLNNKNFKGHTDFFSDYYSKNIAMSFLGPDSNFLLLTDHIAIDEVYNQLKDLDLERKIQETIKGFPKSRKINAMYFAGINPHVGEDGIISKQDNLIKDLASKFNGSVHSGDTMHFHIKDKSQLFIYPFHDQGLGVFKALYGLRGINFSANLPVKRVSVDHGTAFDLYGKNCADISGMNFLLSEIENW